MIWQKSITLTKLNINRVKICGVQGRTDEFVWVWTLWRGCDIVATRQQLASLSRRTTVRHRRFTRTGEVGTKLGHERRVMGRAPVFDIEVNPEGGVSTQSQLQVRQSHPSSTTLPNGRVELLPPRKRFQT